MNQEPKRSLLRWIIAHSVIAVLLLVAIVWLPRFISSGNAAAAREQSKNKLEQLGRAFLDYDKANGRFPAAVMYGPDGKTPHSWRVALLPLLGEKELYDQYRFDEPWDSEHNKKMIAKIPAVYQNPNDDRPAGNSCYFALVSESTMFPPDGQSLRFDGDTDRKGDAIALVGAIRDIPWTKPEDISYDAEKPQPETGGFHWHVTLVLMGDGSVRYFPSDVDENALHRLISFADGNADDAE